jgi:hypothetical protein
MKTSEIITHISPNRDKKGDKITTVKKLAAIMDDHTIYT